MNSKKQFLSIALLFSCPMAFAGYQKNGAAAEVTTMTTEPSAGPSTDQPTAEPLVIRYANSMELMQGSEEGKDFQKEITKTNDDLTNKIKKEQEQITSAIADLENKKSTLSGSAYKAEEAKIEEKKRAFSNNYETYKNDLQLKGQEAGEKLTEKIKDAASEVLKEQGLDGIFDIVTGQPIALSDKAMVTDDLIEKMNQKYKKPAPKTKK